MELAPGTLFSDKFEVERKISEGGMGAIYAVTHVVLGARRALKLMRPELSSSPKFTELFMREARIGAMLQSPHIVQVFDLGVDTASGAPWILMELLDGETLTARLARPPAVTLSELAGYLEQLGAALQRAHAQGVIHRDLKPDNLFLTRDPAHPAAVTLKVLDFGIAKAISEGTSTDVTTAAGTAEWMSPEQAAQGSQMSVRADVWPIGLIAFRALTGKSFWREANAPKPHLRKLVGEVCITDIPTASVRARELGVTQALPQGFDAWFARCVVRDPHHRFDDGATAVEGFLALAQPAIPATVLLTESPRPLDPTSAKFQQLLGAMTQAEASARPHEAIQFGEQALALAPHDTALRLRVANAFLQRARMLDGAGIAPQAIDDLTHALALNPTQLDAWTLRADLLARSARHAEAIVDWSEALARSPRAPAMLEARARAFDAVGQPALARADRALATALQSR